MHQNSDVSDQIRCDTSKCHQKLLYQNTKHQIPRLYQNISLIWHNKLMCYIKSDISNQNLMWRIKSNSDVRDQTKKASHQHLQTKSLVFCLCLICHLWGASEECKNRCSLPWGERPPSPEPSFSPPPTFGSPNDPPLKGSWHGLVWHPLGRLGFDLHSPETLSNQRKSNDSPDPDGHRIHRNDKTHQNP